MDLQKNNLVGLSTEQAEHQRKIHGRNEFFNSSESSILWKYLSHFSEPMISLLLLSGLVSVILGEYEDALSIFMAIFIVVTLAFVQEYNSDKSIAAISKLLPPLCMCYRDKRITQILAAELVPDDIVILHTGDRVPADIKIIHSTNLKVDESSLTGESRSVNKFATINGDQNPKEHNIIFMGTIISYGHAKGVVINTGVNTQFGTLHFLMNQEQAPKSPLKINMEYLGKQISILSTLTICGIILIGLLQKRPLLSMLTMGVSLAVAAIPEGLPIVVTVTLALGVIRMAKRKAIVKKLHVIETLGCLTTFCVDKTGTITTNEMSVVSIYTSEDKYFNLGIKLESTESFDAMASIYNSMSSHVSRQILKTCCVCNNAIINQDNTVIGQATDCALLKLGMKCGIFHDILSIQKLSEIPFSSETKWMSVKVEDPQFDKPVFYIKGAPEVILSLCGYYLKENKTYDIKKGNYFILINSIISNYSSQGFRVIALGYGLQPKDYIFLGLIALADPIRSSIPNTIFQLKSHGIMCKILTGDSKETANSIAKSIGINDGLIKMLSGKELNALDNKHKNQIISQTHVFYRISPIDKINIVKSLREIDQIVAMTGDGVNDAIALRAAHIGIAMGKSGTDACKEAADIVLTDDNIKSILDAITEGKTIFKNIQNFVRFQISSSITALIVISLCTVLNLKPPLNSSQILWINIIMDGPPAQSLGVEPAQNNHTYQSPRSVNEQIIDRSIIINIIFSSLIMIIGIFIVHYREIMLGLGSSHDTTMSFTCFVLFDLFNAINCRSKDTSIFKIGFFTNKTFIYSVIASLFGQLLIIYIPFLNPIFQTTPLSFGELLSLLILTSTVFFGEEIRKYIHHKINR